jgi:hypothetical protein
MIPDSGQILTACAWAAAFSLSSRSFSACLRNLSSRFLANFESGTGLNVRSVRVHELKSPRFQCRRKLEARKRFT